MAERRRTASETTRSPRAPALTPQGREAQLVSLAADLAERQLLEGTASAQVITHYLKLGSSREILEQEKIRFETELLEAKASQIANAEQMETLLQDALSAFRGYSGAGEMEIPDEYQD